MAGVLLCAIIVSGITSRVLIGNFDCHVAGEDSNLGEFVFGMSLLLLVLMVPVSTAATVGRGLTRRDDRRGIGLLGLVAAACVVLVAILFGRGRGGQWRL